MGITLEATLQGPDLFKTFGKAEQDKFRDDVFNAIIRHGNCGSVAITRGKRTRYGYNPRHNVDVLTRQRTADSVYYKFHVADWRLSDQATDKYVRDLFKYMEKISKCARLDWYCHEGCKGKEVTVDYIYD